MSKMAVTSKNRFTRFEQHYLIPLFACPGFRLTMLKPGAGHICKQDLAAHMPQSGNDFSAYR
jgi:hypothetical protein